MKFLIGLSQELFVAAFIILVQVLLFAIPIFIIYKLIKRLIRYNAECRSQYEKYHKAEQDLDDIERDLYSHKDEF